MDFVICFVQTFIHCFDYLLRIVNYYVITIFVDLAIYQVIAELNYLCIIRMYVIS